MQKVFLLLRGNEQTGPFSLTELIKFDLTPYDLIWIEGASAGWYYPQEIEALRPHLSFLHATPPAPVTSTVDTTSPRSVFVAMPAAASPPQQPAAVQPSQTAMAASTPPAKAQSFAAADVFDKMSDSPLPVTGEKTPVPTNSKQKPALKAFVVAGLLLLLGLASWKVFWPSAESAAATTLQAPVGEPLSTGLVNDSAAATSNNPSVPGFKQKLQRKPAAAGLSKPTAAKPSQPVERPAASAEGEAQPDAGNETIFPEVPPVTEPSPTSGTATEPLPAEKKKLRDKIADLFRKKPEQQADEAKPTNEENGRRQSTRRETGSSLAQLVTLRFDVPNDWMLGIKGAKATLTNKSSETLAKALIEVSYYNDENEVLAKRTIQFGNVRSRQSQTVAVPDHQTATRLEYVVLSAEGAVAVARR